MQICYAITRSVLEKCFSPATQSRITALHGVVVKGSPPEHGISEEWLTRQVAGCDAVITGWGTTAFTANVLKAAPNLKAVFHSAGTLKSVETDEMWEQVERVTSAANVNGVPVAEFLLGQILMALKGGFVFPNEFRQRGRNAWQNGESRVRGYYGSTIGIIGMGNVGKHLLQLLSHFDFRVIIHSFYPFEVQAEEAGVQLTDIDTIMKESDVVVVAAPNIPEYRRMFDRRRFALMKDGTWFLNAARGALVDEAALLAELQSGRINACLDVTDPEPPEEGSPFYSLPNCILTPHVAGSMGVECLRLGDQVLKEIQRYLEGRPAINEITRELSKLIG